MLREAIKEAAAYDRYYRESVEAGLREAREGKVISNEEMQAEMKELLSSLRSSQKWS